MGRVINYITGFHSELLEQLKNVEIRREGKGYELFVNEDSSLHSKTLIVEKGFEVAFVELKFDEDTEIRNLPREGNDYFSIMFTNSDQTFERQGEKIKVSKNTDSGVLFSNRKQVFTSFFKANVNYSWIILRFDNEWIKKFVKSDDDFLNHTIVNPEPFFIYDHITIDMQEIIERLVNGSVSDKYANLLGQAFALELACEFFERLYQRRQNPPSHIHPEDMKKLFMVKERLLSSIGHPPTIDELAKLVAWSPSKLKLLFKEVFGSPIRQFFQEHRMQEAKKMLTSGKYSVSEVGYELGYTNLSHFSEAFKKQFKMLPNKVVKKNR